VDQRLHNGRAMRRTLWFWVGLVGSCWLPAFALAQSSTETTPTATSTSGGIGVQLKSVGDESYTSQALRGTPLGKTQCDLKVNLVFVLTNLAVGSRSPKYIEIYKGTACNTTEGKDGLGNDDCERIKFINRTQSSTYEMLDIPIEDVCNSEGDVTLWFLPVDTLGTNANITPYGMYDLPLDTIAPNPPANVKGGDGETQIRITWERTDSNISRNWLIWDPKPVSGVITTDGGSAGSAAVTDDDGGTDDGIVDTSCGSPLLTPGEAIDVDKLPKGLSRKQAVGNVESAELSGSDINSPRAAVAVVSQDLAGNFSVLSNVTCVNVVDTSGFWDEYKVNGGDADGGCACSLPGSLTAGTRHTAGGLLAAFALFGLVIVRMRRKRLS
jgi:hypothetical protein